VLARRRRGLDEGGLDERLGERLRPAFTGTMAESGGIAAGHIPEGHEVTIELPESVSAGARPKQFDEEPEGGWS